jgi:O-antigen/teichoic acid export membrane protein
MDSTPFPQPILLDERDRQRLPVRANVVWALLGNTVYGASQWGIVVLLARMGGVSMVGQYGLGLAIISPIYLLASLNLRALQVSDVREEFQFSDYLGTRLGTTAAAFLLAVLIALFGRYSFETSMVVIGIAAARGFEALSEVFHGSWHQWERMDRIARSLVLRGLCQMTAISCLVWWRESVIWAVASVACVSAAVMLFYDAPRIIHLIGQVVKLWNRIWPNMKAIARMAGPLGFILMLVSLNAALTRYWLAYYLTERDVGFFSAISYMTIAANTLVMALGQASGPGMARSYARQDAAAFLRQACRLGGLGLLAGVGGIAVAWLAGEQIIQLCYGPSYIAHVETFRWLMVAGAFGFLASCAGYILSSARCFTIQIPMLLLVGLAISAGCCVLIPAYGIPGAALAQTIGSATQFVISLILVGGVYRGISGPSPESTSWLAIRKWNTS